MVGLRLSGVAHIDIPPLGRPPFPYVAFETGTVNTIWLMGDPLLPPQRLSTASGTALHNPMLNPADPSEALFASTSGGNTIIYTLDLDNNTKAVVRTITGMTIDPMPYWHPNGTTIVYRTWTGSGLGVYDIRSIESDGTNDQSLYSYTPVGFGEGLSCCCYSPSGDYIAFGKGLSATPDEVWVMQDDGTSPGAVATSLDTDPTALQWSTPYCWMGWKNNSDVLGWAELGSSASGNTDFRKVNADGTGLTTLASVPNRASPAPQLTSVGVGRFPWLLDDSAMVTLRVDGTSAPIWRLALVADSGGISFLGSQFSYASLTGNPFGQASWNYTPQIFNDGLYSDGRIYFTGGAPTGTLINQDVVSVAADGTDFRTDDDGTVSPAHGWWTVTGTAD